MTNFKKFDEFTKHLINHVNDGKDVYVFGWLLDDETDYSFDNESDDYEYYITDSTDFEKLLSYFTIMINENEEYCIVYDKLICHDEEDENHVFLNSRIHIFKTV